jgi:predicted glycosyl hydrolase (DUF1957 family)
MYWANFLHIYQPPTRSEDDIRKISDECYRKLIDVLGRNQTARITLDINASLTERLDRYGLSDVIDGLRRLAERGQIELTASAMYHPILPLLPHSEMARQIALNTEVNRKYFGEIYKPAGFFPPEMCYSKEVAQTVLEMGYRWIIVDEIALDGKLGHAPCDKVYTISGLKDFFVFFKERRFSAEIEKGSYQDADGFLTALGERTKKHEYLLTGTDCEAAGQHRPEQEKLLKDVYKGRSIGTCTISNLTVAFKHVEPIAPLPSSWSASEDEVKEGIPYAHWSNPDNELHKLQWQLTHFAIDAISSLDKDDIRSRQARHLLDKALYSYQYWWASCRPWWDMQIVEQGAAALIEAIQEAKGLLPREVFTQARGLHNELHKKAMQFQYSGDAERMRHDYLKSHQQAYGQQASILK